MNVRPAITSEAPNYEYAATVADSKPGLNKQWIGNQLFSHVAGYSITSGLAHMIANIPCSFTAKIAQGADLGAVSAVAGLLAIRTGRDHYSSEGNALYKTAIHLLASGVGVAANVAYGAICEATATELDPHVSLAVNLTAASIAQQVMEKPVLSALKKRGFFAAKPAQNAEDYQNLDKLEAPLVLRPTTPPSM
jgi:hypothetical protein